MDDEKPLDLRDRFAIEILNGLIANSKPDNDLSKDFMQYLTYSIETDLSTRKAVEIAVAKKMEKIIRNCYKVADLMRKIRLEVFT